LKAVQLFQSLSVIFPEIYLKLENFLFSSQHQNFFAAKYSIIMCQHSGMFHVLHLGKTMKKGGRKSNRGRGFEMEKGRR
jgi:hypothetical protein